jgi:hypothetical protein
MAFRAASKALHHLSLSSKELLHTSDDCAVKPESIEWVVFSPSMVGDTSTLLSVTHQPFQESDIANVATASSQQLAHVAVIPENYEKYTDINEEDDESSLDSAETDSLQLFCDYDDPAILPKHDGLGTFQTGVAGFRSLEESLRIAATSKGSEQNDTHSRIQKWRMEHGHALMDEVERATRRRCHASLKNQRNGRMVSDSKLDTRPTMRDDVGTGMEPSSLAPVTGCVTEAHSEEGEISNQTFWKRITKSFIQGIIGIDDHLLEVVFGQSLPVEVRNDGSSEEGMNPNQDLDERILSRIAKELGELLNLYTHHPSGMGAFTAQRRCQAEDDENNFSKPHSNRHLLGLGTLPSKRYNCRPVVGFGPGHLSEPQFQFTPTLAVQHEEAFDVALWGIEEGTNGFTSPQVQLEYWEQDLDLRLVYSFLKSRVYGLPYPTTPPMLAVKNPITALHHKHPLINDIRNSIHERASAKPSMILSSPVSGQGYFVPITGTTVARCCASQERVIRDRRSSVISFRKRGYYWDVATSVGSGKSGSCVGTGMWAAI